MQAREHKENEWQSTQFSPSPYYNLQVNFLLNHLTKYAIYLYNYKHIEILLQKF